MWALLLSSDLDRDSLDVLAASDSEEQVVEAVS
jgi:hypothetical protein